MKNVLTRILLLFALVVLAACGGGGGTPESGIARIEITPGTFIFTNVGEEHQLTATAYDAQGNVVETTFNWTSSDASQMSVDAGGLVKAQTLGSVQITTEAEGVGSAPALIAVVETKPGTVLVTDAQVLEIGNPINLAADEFPGVGTLYDVRLKGVTAPAAGTIVMASETKAVAGKVVSSQPLGDEVTVRLEVVALPDLLSRYHLDWTVDLSPYDIVMDDSAGLQSVHNADGSLDLHYANAVEPLAEEKLFEKKFPPKGPSPFKCEASIAAYISSSVVDVKLSGTPSLVYQSYKDDANLPPGYTKVAMVGELTLSGKLGFTAEAGFKGSGQCRLVGRIPIAFLGPLSVFIAPAIPLGVGVTIEGKLIVSSLELTLEGKNGANLELGFVCGPGDKPCESLDKVEPINELKPTVKIPLPPDSAMRAELSGSVYVLSGLDILALGVPFSMIEATFGPVQAANLAFTKTQVEDKSYASSYDLKLEAKAKPGADLAKAIEKIIGENVGTLGFEFSLNKDISKSPVGTLSTDKTQVDSNGTVNFTVDLEAASTDYFLLGYNVTSIELYRKLEGQSEFSFFKSIPVTASNQTRFQETWKPTDQDVGINEFAAFVKTKMPVIELEIAPDSIKQVEVKCSPGLSNGLAPQQTGTCDLNYTGTSTAEFEGYTFTAQVEWVLEPALSFGKKLVYHPKGSVTATVHLNKDCTYTVSPASGLINTATDGELTIDFSTTPPTYFGTGATFWNATFTAVCPDQTFDLPLGGGPWLGGGGTTSPDGSEIVGTSTDGVTTFTYSFQRK
jgi:hypothetical protein